MKMLKRWVAFCLVVLLLGGVAFNNSSLTGSQVEAADLTGDVEVLSETGETEEAESEPAEAAEDETQADDAGTVSEAEAQVTEQAEEPAESQETTEAVQEENGQEAVQSETSGNEATVEAETEAEAAAETEAAAEEGLKELNFENDDVTITVSEVEAGAIPEGAELKVVPILEDDEETEEQYKEVEEQIQKKAEEDEKEIEGFLAYDITFADAEGNKLEPNSEVKVTIEYKEPALPALLTTEDATDTEVSVLHLEEDEDGNVKEVVDMNEAGQVDALETGSEQQVQKVEVRTESFSTFAITWGSGSYNTISVKFVDESGKELTVDNPSQYNISLSNYSIQNAFKISEITENGSLKKYFEITTTSGTTYQFKKALDTQNREVTSLYTSGGKGYYTYSDFNTVVDLNHNRTLSFVYSVVKPDTIATLDTADIIDIDLYTYEYGKTYNCGLYFGSGTGGSELFNQWIGNWTFGGITPYKNSDNKAVQGIMGNKLYYYDSASGKYKETTAEQNWEGIPRLAVGNEEYTNDLFNDETRVNSANLNHLFKSGENGYYVYDSSENYAYYSGESTDFVVYDDIDNKEANTNGDFMPLVDYGDDITTDDWSYGMRVGFNFIQPENGQINGEDMVFSFSGDDDVWVFVDGTLVLDLGGIHGAVGGTINFSTGDVKVESVVDTSYSGITNVLGKTTSLQEIFKLSGQTFEAYSEHRLEFIYFERGASMSNCKLKFNLQPIPSDAINITKKITNTDKEKYTDVEFSFRLYVEDAETGKPELVTSDSEYSSYDLYEGSALLEMDNSVDADGVFKLKDGQTAQFSGIPRNLKYYVEEVSLNSEEYNKVEVRGGSITYYDDEGEEIESKDDFINNSDEYIARTAIKYVYEATSVVFQNWCAGSNLRELQITKAWSGNQTTEDTFSFEIKLGGTAATLQLYTGSYYLKKDGQYYTKDSDGKLIESNDAKVFGTIEDGIVSGIPVGYTVVLTQILSGTYFEVTESELNTETYGTPVYAVTEGTADEINCDNNAYGVIHLGINAEVTVTNSYKGIDIDLEKCGSDYGLTLSGAKVKIEKRGDDGDWSEYINGNNNNGEYDITYQTELQNVVSGTYKITEIKAPSGYQLLKESIYFQVENGTVKLLDLNLDPIEKNEADMYKVAGNKIQIKNDALYALPDAGGSGIYWYLFGGVLLMMAASLMVYKNKRGGGAGNRVK